MSRYFLLLSLLVSLASIVCSILVVLVSNTFVMMVQAGEGGLPALPSIQWKLVSYARGSSTLVALRSINQIAAIGGDTKVALYPISNFIDALNSDVPFADFVQPTRAWDLPCQMCGGNTFAQVLHGRFLIIVPKAAASRYGSNCSSADIVNQVLCLDTQTTPHDAPVSEGWKQIATLPQEFQTAGGLVTFSTYVDNTFAESSTAVANNKLFFLSLNGARNLTNKDVIYDGTQNLCLSPASSWTWSEAKPQCADSVIPSSASFTNTTGVEINIAQISPTSFFANMGAIEKTPRGLVEIDLVTVATGQCVRVTGPTAGFPSHSIGVLSQPYLVSTFMDPATGDWNAQMYTRSPLGGFNTKFTVATDTPDVASSFPTAIVSPIPGLVLVLANSATTDGAVCSDSNFFVYAAQVDTPQYPAAFDFGYNPEGLARWTKLHNKALGRGDLQLEFTFNRSSFLPVANGSSATERYVPPYEFEFFLALNSSCRNVISPIVALSFANASLFHGKVQVNLTMLDVANPAPNPVACYSAGSCPFTGIDLPAARQCPAGTDFAACFAAGCCYNTDTGVCTYPTTKISGTGPQQRQSPQYNDYSYYYYHYQVIPGATPVYGTSGADLPRLLLNFSHTHSRSRTRRPRTRTKSLFANSSSASASSTFSHSHTSTRTHSQSATYHEAEKPTFHRDRVIIYVSAAVGSLLLLCVVIVCIIKRQHVKRFFSCGGRLYKCDDVPLIPSSKQRGGKGGLNDNNDGDDGDGEDDDYDRGYGSAVAIGNEDHTVEAVVQIEGADFAILKIAGRGAFGTVFQGKRLSDGALVAIKQVPLFTKQEVEDATKELETLLSVPYHKNILQVLVAGIRHGDAGTAGELPQVDRYARVRGHPGAHHGNPVASMVLVTPFYKNGDLRGFVNSFRRAGRPVPPLACLSFAAQLCDVLEFLHKHKVVHRDIKPENLLLSDDYKQIVLTDFGLAKLTMMENETLVTKAGSLPYVAPECFHGSYHSTVDNWSVGSLMFAIVTKRVDSDNACVMYLEAQKSDFESMIRRELFSMPKGYVDVVLGLLKDRPDQRWSLKEARKLLAQTIREVQQNFSSQSLESFRSTRHNSEI